MKMMRLLLAVLLAAILIVSLGGMIAAPNFNMFTSPNLSLGNLGFNQISPSEIGKAYILFAPTGQELLYGGSMGAHFKPKLMTNNWTSSMKTSSINQMFAVLAHGIGNNNIP